MSQSDLEKRADQDKDSSKSAKPGKPGAGKDWMVLRTAPLRALAAMAIGFFQELITGDLLCPCWQVGPAIEETCSGG